MRTHLFAAALCIAACTLVGCGKTHEGIEKDVVADMRKLDDVFKGITDEASAKAAPGKIHDIVEDLKKLKKEEEGLSKPSADEEAKLTAQVKADMVPIQEDIQKQMVRILMTPTLSGAMADVQKELLAAGPALGG